MLLALSANVWRCRRKPRFSLLEGERYRSSGQALCFRHHPIPIPRPQTMLPGCAFCRVRFRPGRIASSWAMNSWWHKKTYFAL